MMAGIKGKNTRPELALRRALHRLGFRYRLHVSNLPGKPDMVFPRYHALIFVHGCFWHQHDCHLFKWPATRADFWREKIGGNRERDVRTENSLVQAGWRVLTIWECALKGRTRRPLEEVAAEAAGWLLSGTDNMIIQGYREEHNGYTGSDRLAE